MNEVPCVIDDFLNFAIPKYIEDKLSAFFE